MSTKTLRKRIALVAVAALGAGVLSVAPANAGPLHGAAGQANRATDANELSVATMASTTGSAVVAQDSASMRSVGLLYKDTSTGTAQSATVLSTGALALYFTASAASTLVASAGKFGSLASTTASANSVAGNLLSVNINTSSATTATAVWTPPSAAGTYSISLYVGAGSTLSNPTAGTLVGLLNVTVTSASVAGVYSAADSLCNLATSATTAATTDAANSSVLANASKGYVTVALKDAYGSALAAGALVATATNGAYVNLATSGSTAGTGSTAVYASAPTDVSAIVSQPTANAPLSTTVTITYNGTVVCTKSLTIQGEVASIKVTNTYTQDLGASTGLGYKLHTLDAAGNLVLPRAAAAFAVVSSTLNTTVSAASISAIATTTTDTSVAGYYTTGTYTCGSTAGSSSVKFAYQNASGSAVVSPSLSLRCADNPYSYTASFDKASYVQGEIATLTVKFFDSKGNKANSLTTGTTATVTAPMLTQVGTLAENALGDNNGEIAIKFTVGGTSGLTAGSYQALVNYPTLVAAETASIQTVGYKVSTGDSGVSNADVLKAIVSLIASINKQIAALQKALLRR